MMITGSNHLLATWPDLQTWSLLTLLRLQASWQEIRPETPVERTRHEALLADLATLIAERQGDTAAEGARHG